MSLKYSSARCTGGGGGSGGKGRLALSPRRGRQALAEGTERSYPDGLSCVASGRHGCEIAILVLYRLKLLPGFCPIRGIRV
jgi:hypothetical protein